jgi:hypothetical protein
VCMRWYCGAQVEKHCIVMQFHLSILLKNIPHLKITLQIMSDADELTSNHTSNTQRHNDVSTTRTFTIHTTGNGKVEVDPLQIRFTVSQHLENNQSLGHAVRVNNSVTLQFLYSLSTNYFSQCE